MDNNQRQETHLFPWLRGPAPAMVIRYSYPDSGDSVLTEVKYSQPDLQHMSMLGNAPLCRPGALTIIITRTILLLTVRQSGQNRSHYRSQELHLLR